MSQINLYYQTQLDEKVPLLPHQITPDIDNHLLQNLTTKIKGKTTANGIVIRIYRLIDYEYGNIDKDNFTGIVNYVVRYECLLCSPVKDLEIICVTDNIVKGYLVSVNGPVTIAVQYSNIDINKFSIEGNNIKHNKSGKIISRGDYIKVSVINVNSNMGETNIIALCKLVDLASEEDIKRYKEDQRLISDINSDTNENSKFI